MTIAKVIPLFKSGDTSLVSNYRPISILPLFSKIIERLMYNRLISFINKFKLLYIFQFGFRLDHSPDQALIYLVDKISNALENGEYVIGLFLDFSKAFDTVNHDILLSKMECYGIRGIALNWFKSYLSCRQQYVKYNDVESSKANISCGVPQGSILGPILFLLYINDLAYVSKKIFSLFFADDSNMFISGKDPNELIEVMNDELITILDWLRANRLSLNIDKTHYIIFKKPRSKLILNRQLYIDNHTIDRVTCSKFLGVFIDQNLSFNEHIMYIKGKIARGIGILNKGG